ncbi:MAG: hypothetical protein WC558_04620 [Patulibacter sp.]
MQLTSPTLAKRVATACAVATFVTASAVAAPTTAGAWSDLESRTRLGSPPFSGFDSSGLVVADGRVWWLEGQYAEYQANGFVLASQPLKGHAVRRTALAAGAMPSPIINGRPFEFPSATYFRMRDGQAVVVGSWYAEVEDPNDVNPSGGQFLASFDAGSGTRNRYVDLRSAGPVLANGNPAVFGVPTDSEAGSLSDPVSGREFPIRLEFSQAPEVAGAYLLSFPVSTRSDPAERWARGHGKLRVRELATGRVRYSLEARQLTGAAGLPRSNHDTSVSLMDDGSLKVALSTNGRVAHPVAVDPRGRVRRIGRPIGGTDTIQATLGHGRAFVHVSRPHGKKTLRYRLWITDTAGKRGRVLPVTDRHGAARELPFFWDGHYAVWTTETRGGRRGTWVESSPKQLRLRRDALPANGSR